MKPNTRFIVTVSDAATSEVLAMSEEPVEGKHLIAEGRDIASDAWAIHNARINQNRPTG